MLIAKVHFQLITGTNTFSTVIDEYSRFPSIIPCANMTATTVIKAFVDSSLFSMLGIPAYVHSDRGMSFLSTKQRNFLHEKGIATSRTMPYNTHRNGQSEVYNGTVWKAITLALKTKGLLTSCWLEVLPDVLHSIWSLFCTSTNATPHKRMFSYVRRSTVVVLSWLGSWNQVPFS